MFGEHEQVVLTADLKGDEGEDLRLGYAGVVVHVHQDGEAHAVEFLTIDGDTAAIATELPSQARAVTSKDITHARHVEIPA